MAAQKQIKKSKTSEPLSPHSTLAPPGARESNAGDDFLVLWAARRAIEMLNPSSDLHCVRMEGLSPLDVASLDVGKSYFLAADLTEYFGGTSLDTAQRIVISQLKYSTRNPDDLWTWGELRKTREKGASVIRRLAQSYQDLFTRGATSGKTRELLRAEILAKTTIRLVSNQSADSKVLTALQSARVALKGAFATHSVIWPDLLTHLKTTQGWEKAHTTTLEKLSESCELGDEFTDFLRVLDLSGCGELSRLEQKAALLRSVGESVSFDAMEGLRRVCDLLREETQPEREKSLGVTQPHLLAALEVFSYDSLFPCPPQLETTRRYVPTDDAPVLAQTLLASPNRCLLAHGEAGVGKTTTMQDLQVHLPAGSVALVYDCYGGGNYHDLYAQRHTYDRALPQLSNELATRCGLPFLVKVANNAADALRDFKNRLAAASKLIAESGGVLVVVIDAADNSMTAADAKGDVCFAPHLWDLWNDLPANCFLVMSARTHRQSDLQAPQGTTPYELTGFSVPSSAQYLRHVFPGASERSCDEFHQRTSHNPRVQSYLMDRAQELGAGGAAWFYTVRHARLTPGEIFEDLLRAAVQDVRDPARAEEHLATLTCLMRPIPIPVFAGACSTSEQEALNFCHALRPGVLLGESGLSFRDEDFETHLRSRVGDLTASHARLGAHFLGLTQSDTYAAQTVADHLFAGKCEGETIRLALEGPQPDVITDDLLRLRVVRRRLELGLKSAARGGRDADAVRLLLRTAEVARTNGAVVQLVQEDPELATRYGNPRSVVELCAHKEHVEWFGPAHMQIAALYARDPKTHGLAREHLEQAEAWLRRYMRQPKKGRHWDFTSVDMARRWETIFHLEGLSALQDDVKRWRPREFVLSTVDILVRTVAQRLNREEINEILGQLQLPLRAECIVLSALWERGHLAPRERVEATMQRIERSLSLKRFVRKTAERSFEHPRRYLPEDWPLSLCEMSASHGLDGARTLRILEELGPQPLDRVPHDIMDFGAHLPPLRAACLKASLKGHDLQAEELLPEKYRIKRDDDGKPSHDSYDSERRTFNNTVGLVLPLQKLWARAITSPTPVREAAVIVGAGLKSLKSVQWETEGRGGARVEIFAITTCTALLSCEGDARPLLQEVADALPELAQGLAPHIWIVMAGSLARREAYRDFAARLVERAANVVSQTAMPGKERWGLLLRCAQVIAPFENELGRDLYHRALEAAEGIDDDAAHLLSFAARTASRLAPEIQTLGKAAERRTLATRLCALVEAHQPYVSEESLLPRFQTLDAACRLDPAIGLTIAHRWDDSNLFDIDEGIRPVVSALTESQFWPAHEAVWLCGLQGNEIDVSKPAIECLESLHAQGALHRQKLMWLLDSLCFWVERDTPIFRKREAMERLLGWAQLHGMANRSSVERLQRAIAFARSLPGANEKDSSFSYGAASQETARLWLQSAQFGDTNDLGEAVENLQGKTLADYLTALGENLPFGRRIEFLDAIIALKVEWHWGSGHPVLQTLRVLLDKWRKSNAVCDWAKNGVSRWLEENLPALWGYSDQPYHERADRLETLWTLPLVPSSRAKFLLPAVICRLEDLSAQTLCLIASTLAISLSPEEKQLVLENLLGRLQTGLESDDKELPFTHFPSLPEGAMPSAEALAAFGWMLLSHPDKRVRWKALHALRQILRAPGGHPALLQELMRLSAGAGAGPLASGEDFFWISARTYAMVLFERLAQERPRDLAEHLPALALHALSREFPHAQIRELARRACLQVLREVPDALSTEIAEQLERVNVPFACLSPRKNTYYRRSRTEEKKRDAEETEARFRFDTMDTIPYWFDRLSEKFGDQGPDVADIAERWICDVWGYTQADVQYQHGRRERHDYKHTGIRHGSIPTVETLRTYLSYHAMMCAAGELVDAYPVAVDTYDEPDDPWEDWIEYHLPFFPDCWEADLRGPTPLRPDCWGVLPPSEDWEKKRIEDYDSTFGTQEPGREDWVVVWGNTTHGDSGRSMKSEMQSALVGAKTSRALLSAFQCTDHMNLAFPVVNRHHDKWDLDEGDFCLQPLLQDGPQRDRSLDEKDGAARGVFPSFTLLCDDVVRALDLRPVRGRRDYQNSCGEVVAQLEIWSDDVHDLDRISRAYSHGERLWLRRDVLLGYLLEHDKNLIVEVIHSRNKERSYSHEDRKFDLGKHVIYLFHANGDFETLAGNRAIGPENRQ